MKASRRRKGASKMTTTPGDDKEAGSYVSASGPTATLPLDLQGIVSSIVLAVAELRHSIEAHRAAIEQLTTRADALLPQRPAIDSPLAQSYAQLRTSLGLTSNGNALSTPSPGGGAAQSPAGQSALGR
jgi:hypothetical protein